MTAAQTNAVLVSRPSIRRSASLLVAPVRPALNSLDSEDWFVRNVRAKTIL